MVRSYNGYRNSHLARAGRFPLLHNIPEKKQKGEKNITLSFLYPGSCQLVLDLPSATRRE
jgi:hypothetical protein